MIRSALICIISLAAIFASQTAMAVGGYSQSFIAHNLTGETLSLDCTGGLVERSGRKNFVAGSAAVLISASLEESSRNLLGGRYECLYTSESGSGRITFTLRSRQTINVWTITEEGLKGGRFSCTAERFSNFSRPGQIIRAANAGEVHEGGHCR